MIFGRSGERAGDADALPLAAGELVRVAVVVLRVEADDLQQLLHPGQLAALGHHAVGTQRGADDVPTVCRGFSDEYGSWKIS
jgi:hypothetical protein